MSPFSVLEAPGSERSRPSESTQKDAQGEFGVTCKAVTRCVKMVVILMKEKSET